MLPHDYRNPALLQDRCFPQFTGKQQRHWHHLPLEFSSGNPSFTRGATEGKFGSSVLQCWEAGPGSDLPSMHCPKWASQCGPGSRMGTGNSPPAVDTKLRCGQSNVPFPTAKVRGLAVVLTKSQGSGPWSCPRAGHRQTASGGQRGQHSAPRKSHSRDSVLSRNFRGCSEQVKAVLHLLRSTF